ncbi:MAG TPA: hypothetical protein VJB34_07405 [Bdellovibrionota bacterium]|nr:hypothetical protein [Bdellovibrionota bacterium]
MTEEKSKKGKPESSEEEAHEVSLTDLAKKAFYTGLGAIFLTEETVRNVLSDVKVPKEAMFENIKKAKQDFVQILSGEIRNVLSKIDVSKEMQKLLETHSLHIKADIEFKPKQKP